MALQSYPTEFSVEFRGLEPASSFVNRETGELVERPASLKLERELEDGDVMPVVVMLREEVEAAFEPDDLKRGESLTVVGEVRVWSGKNGGGGMLVPTSVKRRAGAAAVRPVAAAS